MRPLELRLAAREQDGIRLVQVARGGHRHQMIASEEARFTLNAALFVAFARRT
jgi:hypothetical protein